MKSAHQVTFLFDLKWRVVDELAQFPDVVPSLTTDLDHGHHLRQASLPCIHNSPAKLSSDVIIWYHAA